ncbi:MAG: selenide, water dikinase SelD [Candidatus Azotimanducaceae bacterium]
MNKSEPIARELVLVGGGHSHIIVLRMLGMHPIPGLQITLVSPNTRTAYSGMLPGMIAGDYSEDEIHIDLVPLCRFAGARYVEANVESIDPILQLVRPEGRPSFSYDVLSIDIGSSPSLNVRGALENVIPVKPINEFLARWDTFLDRVSSEDISSIGFVGAGAGGVELCLAAHNRINQMSFVNAKSIAFHLFSDGHSLLPKYSINTQRCFEKVFRARDIQIHSGFRVKCVEGKVLISESDQCVSLDAIFWATGSAAQPWLKNSGLSLTGDGFVKVKPTLQTENFPNIFAVGDIAHMTESPRPKAGVFAVRQGPPLTRNIRNILLNKELAVYKPQREFLSLISTGNRYAIASRNGYSFGGRSIWKCKDWIDRRFISRFSEFPKMPSQSEKGLLGEFDEQMQCGGCGSKVSAELLSEVLDDLGNEVRDDASEYLVPEGKTMLHSVDHFKSFVDDPYVFAQIAVTHALSDIYAMGGMPVTALAMVTVPFGKPPVVKSILRQLLAGTKHQLELDNVELIGGHTTEGSDLSIGFAVNGIVDDKEILRKSGMLPDQVIILTKPLGTGTLFAADMQYRARGTWIQNAIRSMKQRNNRALEILQMHGVTACTDVTGFGLAGHLGEMMQASKCGVDIQLGNIPVLDGSIATLYDMGIKSTLHDGNRRAAGRINESLHANFELLFDPQTSGGLIGSIAADRADTCVSELRRAGYPDAAAIGVVTAGSQFQLY